MYARCGGQCGDDGGEHGDEELDDSLPLFHIKINLHRLLFTFLLFYFFTFLPLNGWARRPTV